MSRTLSIRPDQATRWSPAITERKSASTNQIDSTIYRENNLGKIASKILHGLLQDPLNGKQFFITRTANWL